MPSGVSEEAKNLIKAVTKIIFNFKISIFFSCYKGIL